MIERVVINASPMIALLAIGQEGLLPMLFDEVLIPDAVREEIEAGRSKDANALRLATLTWLGSAPVAPIPESVQGWGLGRGESSVLAVTAAETGCRAIAELAGQSTVSCVTTRNTGNCGRSPVFLGQLDTAGLGIRVLP